MVSTFRLAAAGAPLTPGQRALLKLVKTFLYAFAASGLAQAPVAVFALSTGHYSTTGSLAAAVLAQVLTVAGLAWDKFCTAQGDIKLAADGLAVAQDLAGKLNDVANKGNGVAPAAALTLVPNPTASSDPTPPAA